MLMLLYPFIVLMAVAMPPIALFWGNQLGLMSPIPNFEYGEPVVAVVCE
jgi:hypothetical protein